MEKAEEYLYLQVIDKSWLVFEVGSVFDPREWMKEGVHNYVSRFSRLS